MLGLRDSNLGEVQFTSLIARSPKLVKSMIEVAGLSNVVDFNDNEISDQDRSTDKRPDIVLRHNGEVTCVIEAQDQNGTLDFYHTAKLPLYMHTMDCGYGIMIADEVPESFRAYLKNQAAAGYKISIVCPIILDDKVIGFNSLYKAEKSSIKAANDIKSTSDDKSREKFLAALSELEGDETVPKYEQQKNYTYLSNSSVGNMLRIHYGVNALTVSVPVDYIKGNLEQVLSNYQYDTDGKHDGADAVKIKVKYGEVSDADTARMALNILSDLNDKVKRP